MLDFLLHRQKDQRIDLLTSKLLDQDTFYPVLLKDLKYCHSELIIESPFITYRRLSYLLPSLEKLKARKARIVIITRDPLGLEDEYRHRDTHDAISKLQHMGIQVIYAKELHRKLVIIDRQVLHEGSLNILSQSNSTELMRRIESVKLAWEMVRFIGIDK
jgi:HKD family nuclease